MNSSIREWLPAALATLLLAPAFAGAAEIPFSVRGERQDDRFVRLTKAIEADPLAENNARVMQWMIRWAAETRMIRYTACNPLGPAFDRMEASEHGVYVLFLSFGNVTFQIEHPDQVDDEYAIQTAAVESVLRAYAATRAQQPEHRVPTLDALQASLDAGTLAAELRPVILEKCIQAPVVHD